MTASDRIFIGGGGEAYGDAQTLLLKYGNRHGLISGATGTGKTVTLQIMAESFSAAGVPVFLSDVKGDLSGLCMAGSPDHKLHGAFMSRAETIKFDDYGYDAFPVVFWDMFGEKGHPIRATITEMGPLLLARLLDLTEAQEGILNIVFRIADEEGLLLIDLKDLQSMLVHVGERSKELALRYGNISTASVGAIQRRLLVLENQGADQFFGEPALELEDMIATTPGGEGRINILAADRLMQSPRLYATFLLWLLSELFEQMPEVGNPDKPKFVFFFDEAHLLFDDAPKALIDKVEQVARLIRSKGVGVYFITQKPADVPDDVLGATCADAVRVGELLLETHRSAFIDGYAAAGFLDRQHAVAACFDGLDVNSAARKLVGHQFARQDVIAEHGDQLILVLRLEQSFDGSGRQGRERLIRRCEHRQIFACGQSVGQTGGLGGGE